jgi:hypothetical protein
MRTSARMVSRRPIHLDIRAGVPPEARAVAGPE